LPARAGVLGRILGDLARVVADDDVLGHDRAGEPAVADRVEDRVDLSGGC
jgi:hypothetical protein